jgi:hypothetical protein
MRIALKRGSPSRQVIRILACAVVLGLSIPTAYFGLLRISVLWPINTPSWNHILTYTVVSLLSYLSVGLLLSANKVTRNSRYCWVFLSAAGSCVLAIIYTFYRLPPSELTLSEWLLIHLREALGTTFWLTLFTLPISALFYHAASLVRRAAKPSEVLKLTAR